MENNTFLKFKKLLKFVFENKYSDFYRVKFQKAGFNPLSDFNSLDDIKKIPLLTKEELSAVDPFKLLFVEKEKIDYITTTSGTTGKPLLIFYSYPTPDFSLFSKDHPPSIDIAGAKILTLLNPIRFYGTHYYLNFLKNYYSKIKSKGIINFFGDIHNIPFSLEVASQLGINIISTTPSLAIILKDYLESFPNLKKSLNFLTVIGELVTPQRKKLLQELYPNLVITVTYGLAEIGGRPATQCSFLAKKNDQIYFHPLINYHFEIIDPISEKEVEIEKEGELVITCFHNLATPLIRYKTGDLAKFHKNDCPCGYPGPLLEVLGRVNYDMVRAGGFELKREMAEKPILNLKDFLEDSFEVHIYENFVGTKPRIKMILNLSLKKGVKKSLELREKIENEFLENWQLSPRLNLKKAIEAGIFEPLQINFVKFPKTIKPKGGLILHHLQ